MRKQTAILLATVLILAGAANTLNAAVTLAVGPGDYLKFVATAHSSTSGYNTKYPDGSGSNLYGGGGGGEFKFLVGYGGSFPDHPTDDSTYLVTFCAERTEYIYLGQDYKVDSLVFDDGSKPDFDFAKWVFWAYTTDQEKDNVVPDRVSGSSNLLDSDLEAKEIQDAIWRALGATPQGWITMTKYNNWYSAYQNDNTWPLANDDSAVAVLLSSLDHSAQDQWVFVEGVSNIIPEPASLLVWSLLGLAAVVGTYRFRPKA